MKINQLTYYDKKIEWRLDPIQFSDLNLLVGISGVGKTQILKSIINLRSIARGRSLNGAKWDVEFSINNNTYQWQGEFEHNAHKLFSIPTSEESDNKFRFIHECLYLNHQTIIERDSTKINFKGNKLPKLSSFTSAISILSEEEDIYPVTEGFNRLIFSEQSKSDYNFDEIYHTPNSFIANYDYYQNLANQNLALETIQESHLPIQMKLGLAYKHKFSVFQEIKQQFINMFEHVKDIKIEPDKNENIPKVISEYPLVEIKEKGVDMWIKQNQISSGMFRTLMHISELYLSADGTIILIDEFENSLGVNCIDILTDLLMENRKLQFIITSHHPYIINKIGMEHWKIITRKGSVVTAKQIKEFNLPKSRHQAFMQLINLDAYREGIAVG